MAKQIYTIDEKLLIEIKNIIESSTPSEQFVEVNGQYYPVCVVCGGNVVEHRHDKCRLSRSQVLLAQIEILINNSK